MPDYTIYSGTSGAYLLTLTMPDLAQAELNVEPGDVLVEGDFGAGTYWTGSFVQNLPARPEDWLVWTGSSWADPRSEADVAGQLHQARVAASLTPGELIYRLAQFGAFPMSEIANSLVPQTFDDFLALPAFDGAPRQDIRAGLTHWAIIPRTHELLHGPVHPDDPGTGLPDFASWLAAERSITITPADFDTIFEVAVPPPLYVPD